MAVYNHALQANLISSSGFFARKCRRLLSTVYHPDPQLQLRHGLPNRALGTVLSWRIRIEK